MREEEHQFTLEDRPQEVLKTCFNHHRSDYTMNSNPNLLELIKSSKVTFTTDKLGHDVAQIWNSEDQLSFAK